MLPHQDHEEDEVDASKPGRDKGDRTRCTKVTADTGQSKLASPSCMSEYMLCDTEPTHNKHINRYTISPMQRRGSSDQKINGH